MLAATLRMRPKLILVGVLLAAVAHAHSPRDLPSEDKPDEPIDPTKGQKEWISFHFQTTAATQYHPSFFAKYSGKNSLSPNDETASAFVSTLYADMRLWPGAELLVNPELSGGLGLSHTLGVAAFPSAIVYRVGDPAPAIYLARLAISQTIGLGGGKIVNDGGPNELAGKRDKNQLAITVGRLSVTDVFDGNRWAHDASERFFNWALFASGAWDYPADTRGYTWGALGDLAIDWWSIRAGAALEPKYANLLPMDTRIDKSIGLMWEAEARYKIGKRPGAVSLLGFLNFARMGSYADVLKNPALYDNNVANTRKDGRAKYGFALSFEQQITHGLGTFIRMSINDGQSETWAFAEIDRSIAFGAVQDGELWKRPKDEMGIAMVINGLSPWHRDYLAGGCVGFMLGDGKLNYGSEIVTDIYYRLELNDQICFSAIYQPIVNPGYNQDRGPVHVFSIRAHVAF